MLDELRNLLLDAPGDLGRLRGAAELVARERRELAELLCAMAERGERDSAVARSYWHPNGFAKLVLHAEEAFRLRLHVWPVADRLVGESNPHSHRWDFASTVVAGAGLVSEEFRELADDETGGRRHHRYRYGIDPNDRSALVRDGAARLERTAAPTIPFGGVYTCDTSVVHTVMPREHGLTATVVVQGPHRSSSTTVYCEPGTSEDQPNRPMLGTEFRWLVKSVAEACEATP